MSGLMISLFIAIGIVTMAAICGDYLEMALDSSSKDEDKIDILIDEMIDDAIMDIRNGYKQNMNFIPPSHVSKKRTTVCPHCGAPVSGECCEYCGNYI